MMYNCIMEKDYSIAIGMMSGTSLDGIDACLVKIYNDMNFEILDSYSMDYPKDVREKLFLLANNNGNVKDVCLMDFIVGKLFAKCALGLIDKSGLKKDEIDFIASHGQTICHIPQEQNVGEITSKSTLQIGNVSVISALTGITTVGDFRSKDIAVGGEGAPLVPFADEIIFKKDIPRAIQNIGGIGNVTVLSQDCDTFAFDTGPGNMLIDYFSKKLFDVSFDKDGEFASQGRVDEQWLQCLLREPYYDKIPPKSTGRELFNNDYAEKIFLNAPKQKCDVIATVTMLTARTISEAYQKFVLPKTPIKEIVLGGGGAYNKTLIKYLNECFSQQISIKTHSDFGIDDKVKESLAFALLGFCTINKKFNNVPTCTGAKKRVIMGIVSYS